MFKSSKYVKIKFLHCFLMLVLLISDTLEFHVRGSGPLVVPLGGSVVLPCYVETPLVMENVKVEWTRTDSDILVHLFLNGDIRPEAQHQDYHDRAHFFTEDIKHGNFSLLLNNLTAEDKGVYRCKVYTGQAADKTLVEIKDVEYLIVSRSNRWLSASVGDDITLSCSVDSHIKPEEIEEVSWTKKVKDEDILVLLYQNNKTQSGSSDEQYRDRVEFFTDEIHRGNFSLRLKRVTTEDKGVYICQVFTKGLSANTTVILETLGFSALHIMVLILCIAACVSALLFCPLTYCALKNKGIKVLLHVCLHFCPNIMMALASILWYAAEGSCCSLFILRPLRLFWITPHISDFPDTIINHIKSSHADQYFPAVLVAMYSALLAEHFKDIDTITVKFVWISLVLLCLSFVIHLARCCMKLLSAFGKLCKLKSNETIKSVAAWLCFYLLPSAQLSLFIYSLVGIWTTLIIAAVVPVFAGSCFLNGCWTNTKRTQKLRFIVLDKVVWILMCLMNVRIVYLYIEFLRNKEGNVGLVCIAGFLQALWVNIFSEVPVNNLKFWSKNILFLFGSVGLVLVNSVALMTDLIFKAVNGKHLFEDQRIIVFPSEFLFTSPLLILPICTPWTAVTSESQGDSRNSADLDGTHTEKLTPFNQNQSTESLEMDVVKVPLSSEEKKEDIT
ncbi:uncharacterized protein [Misgurnus anguillicaudatus]|uniref:uncharacterized protein n=1 Tax=Misgurnus anguillicaudatus TaxID=75329 RepID=UPI003CCF94A8